MKNIAWSDDIACEGGPVLVANLDDFEQWRGSDPFDSSRATALHYWSPFTSDLPEQWRPNGPAGHQYIANSDPSKLREMLMSLLIDQWPGTTIDRSDSTWRAIRPDGRVLNAALSPDSEYDLATRDLGAEGVHRFGRDGIAYLWSAAPGMVRIDIDENRNFLLLSQVEYADDEADAQKAHEYALRADPHSAAPGERYRITSGPVVAVWSPNSARDLSRPISRADTSPSVSGMLLDMATDGSGALFWLEPGLYQSSLQYHEQDSWAVSWCRLHRVDE